MQISTPPSPPAADATSTGPALVRLRPGRLVRVLLAFTLLLSAASFSLELASLIHGRYPGRDLLLPLFRLGSEANLPTAFSTLLFWIAAALMWLLAGMARHQGSVLARNWTFLAGLFVYLGLDEEAQFHERTISGLRRLVGDSPWLHYTWVLPYAVLVVAVVAFSVPLLRRLAPRLRAGVLLAGALYVLGAMGLEVIEGMLEFDRSDNALLMLLLITVEETLEMLGLLLMIATLLSALRQGPGAPRITVDFSPDGTQR